MTTTEAKDLEVRHSYLLMQGTGRDAALVQVSRAKAETRVYAYAVAVDKDVEATLKLARQMSWSKESELAIMAEQRRVQEQER